MVGFLALGVGAGPLVGRGSAAVWKLATKDIKFYDPFHFLLTGNTFWKKISLRQCVYVGLPDTVRLHPCTKASKTGAVF